MKTRMMTIFVLAGATFASLNAIAGGDFSQAMAIRKANQIRPFGTDFGAPTVDGNSNISNPRTGDIVFDTSVNQFFGYNGSTWAQISGALLSSDISDTSSGVAVLAYGDFLFSTQPNAGDYICMNALPFTDCTSSVNACSDAGREVDFVTSGANPSLCQVNIGADLNATITNVVTAVSGSGGLSPWVPATYAVLSSPTSGDLRVTAGTSYTGSAGNDLTDLVVPPSQSRITLSHVDVSDGLEGGSNAGIPVVSINNGALLQLPVQGSGDTPACASGTNGALALTNGHILCVCTGSSWVQTSDGATSCTF